MKKQVVVELNFIEYTLGKWVATFGPYKVLVEEFSFNFVWWQVLYFNQKVRDTYTDPKGFLGSVYEVEKHTADIIKYHIINGGQ